MKSWTASLALAVATLSGHPTATNAIRLSGKYTSNPELTAKIMEHAQYYYPPHSNGDGDGVHGPRELSDVDASSFEITAAHTILFRSCESLTVQADFGNNDDDNGISQTLKSMYAAGQVKAEKSYILFDVCLSEYCDSGKASDHTTFITDMASFINAFLQFIPNKTQAYCQGCFDNQEYCAAESQKYYTSSGSSSSSSSNNGGRRLAQNSAELVEYIDCNQCSTFGCYSGAYATVDYSLQWIQSKTQCTRSNNPFYYNGLEITTGFMCNQAGDGVEIAAFVDQDCTLYTNQVAYGNLLTGSEYKYWYNSKTHIEYMFNVGYSCYDPTITYINPTDEAAGTYGYNYQASAGEYYSPATAEYCSNVFQGSNMDIVQVGTCSASDSSSSSSGNSEAVAEEDFQQVYTLAEGDIYNGNAVCAALTGMGGSGEHLYEKSASGAMYKYTGGAKTSATWQKEYNKKNRSRKGAWIAFAVLAVLSAGTGVAFYFYRQKDHTEEDYEQQQQQADKKEPLVDINEPDAPVDENASAYA